MRARAWILAYAALGSLLVGRYALAEWFGWESTEGVTQQVSPSVRQSPGGWRSWTFWHTGPHGGK